jgi:ABC-type Fe3+/spermidine/putrescine transport system ATPase subunit
MNMSDRIAIMNHGRIEQLGPPAEIYEHPVNAFIGRFLGEANLIEGTLEHIAGDEASVRSADGILFRARFNRIATPGRKAALFARPEKLSFGGGAGGNVVEATVRRRSFLGNIIRTVVEAGPRTHLTIDQPNSGDGAGPEAGASVTVNWSVAHSLILLD